MSAPTKIAARKTAQPKPSPSMTFQNALRSKDASAVASLLLADLKDANTLAESLVAIISAQAKHIQSLRGLASLAIGQGPR